MDKKLALLGGTRACGRIPPLTQNFSKQEEQAVIQAMRKGLTIFSNPVIKRFERLFAEYVGTEYAVSTSSCTSAMRIVLASLREILGEIRYVIVPAYSYIAIVNAILSAGLKYKLVDNDQDTLSLSSNKLEDSVMEKGTLVLLPYMFGLHPDIDGITRLLDNPQLSLIEDCAQGAGTYHRGKHVGTFGCGCFSFAEVKTMTTAGEGGMIVTDDKDVARLCRIMSHQGIMWQDIEMSFIDSDRYPSFYDMQHRFDCSYIGQTSRMTAVQAATGIVQLKKLDKINSLRWKNAKYLIDKLTHHEYFKFPYVAGGRAAMNMFPILIKDDFYASRDVFLQCLREEGVPASIYSPRPLFEYSIVKRTCSNSVNPKKYPVAKWIAQQHILLPIYTSLTETHLSMIVSSIDKVTEALSDDPIKDAARKEVAKRLGASADSI